MYVRVHQAPVQTFELRSCTFVIQINLKSTSSWRTAGTSLSETLLHSRVNFSFFVRGCQ